MISGTGCGAMAAVAEGASATADGVAVHGGPARLVPSSVVASRWGPTRGALVAGLVSALLACASPPSPSPPTWTAAPVVIATAVPPAAPTGVPPAATPVDPPTPPP